MPGRVTKPDAKGKPRVSPSGAAQAYGLVRQARPAWPMYHAALVSDAMLKAAVGYGLPPDKFGKMLDGLLTERLRTATERDVKRASARANKWESNPMLKEMLALLFQREMVRPSLLSAAGWVDDVTRIGDKAEKAKDWDAALDSRALLVKHVPTEGLLSGKDVADKPSQNLNITLLWGGSNEPLNVPKVVDAESARVE